MLHPGSWLSLFSPRGDFLPHALCLSTQPGLVWVHATADSLIAASYYSIPFALAIFAWRRRDLTFRWMFVMFMLFIMACGTTHAMHVWTLWRPDYVLEGVVKAVTAVISLATASLMWPLLPNALALPSPAQLARLNEKLAAQVAERRAAEQEVRAVNAHLEQRVRERTIDLERSNHLLHIEIGERRKAEEALRKANESLERRVAERTAEVQDANECLRASEAHYAAFFNHVAEGLFLVRVDGADDFFYETINPSLARHSGLNAEAVRGRAPAELFPPRDAQRQIRHFQDCLASGGPIEYEETVETPAGTRVWHIILVPVAGNGAISRLMGSVRDVTETKQLQEELVQSSKLATLGTLAAGIAHETSQPLNIIRLSVDTWLMMAEDGEVPPEFQQRTLRLVSEQTRRMGTIIDHMRHFSRRDHVNEEIFEALLSLRRAVALVERHYALDGVLMEVEAEASYPVRGWPMRLEQVILNMLSNAHAAILEARSKRGVSYPGMIRLRAEATADQVVLTVEDNGGGIPDHLVGHLFEPFLTTRPVGKGSGLGLSISYGIIDDMGGRILAGNGPEGAQFRIELPTPSAPRLRAAGSGLGQGHG